MKAYNWVVIISCFTLCISSFTIGLNVGRIRDKEATKSEVRQAQQREELRWQLWYINRTKATTRVLETGKEGFYVGADATEQLWSDLGKIVHIWQQHPDSLYAK